ncbi:MAG: HAD family hydrolase [Vulcanimicrobiota bacterium]
MKILTLFDIDGTLITKPRGVKHSSHGLAFNNAFNRIMGVTVGLDSISYHGKTDMQIILEVLTRAGFAEEVIYDRMDEIQSGITRFFNDKVSLEEILVLEGIENLLESLVEQKAVMGLVTGNIEEIAYRKLQLAGLDHYFPFGGFGGTSHIRSELVEKAIGLAEKQAGSLDREKVFVIGDTPRDVVAAHEAGVKAVGVATGIYSVGELKEAGADEVFADFSNCSLFLEKILG